MEKVPFQLSLKACRANANLSQKELAEKLGVSPLTILNWENGIGEPSFSQVKDISSLTNIPMDFIRIADSEK